MRKVVVAVIVSLAFTATSFAQDLNKLQARAQKLLDLRSTVNLNKPQAAQFIEKNKRQEFLESQPLPLQDAKVIGLDFSDDPNLVYVIFKGNVILPDIGPVPRTGREPWVWDKKDWFLQVEDLGNFFLDTRNAPPVLPAKPVPLEFAPKQIDLGKHAQGEILKGLVEFKSVRDEIKMFRPAELPGLTFGKPDWKSKEDGEIEFYLDTGLFSQDIDYHAEFEVEGFQEQRTRAAVELTAQIQPRLRITQNPPLIDPAKPTTVEFKIENLSDQPFGFKTLYLSNPAYQLAKDPPDIVGPGESATIVFAYSAGTDVLNASLRVELTEPIVGQRALTFPLNVKMPEPVRPGYTREQLEEIIRKSRP